MAKKTTLNDTYPPEKLRRKSWEFAGDREAPSPGTKRKVWEAVKKLWKASERPGRGRRSRPTTLKVSQELDMDLEDACDAVLILSEEGYLDFNTKLRRRPNEPYKRSRPFFYNQQLIPKTNWMNSRYVKLAEDYWAGVREGYESDSEF